MDFALRAAASLFSANTASGGFPFRPEAAQGRLLTLAISESGLSPKIQ
jgi:hypothetical protein